MGDISVSSRPEFVRLLVWVVLFSWPFRIAASDSKAAGRGPLAGSAGGTATQYLLTYTPDKPEFNCHIIASESMSFAPVVNALNESMFPGSSSDQSAGSKGKRAFLIGKRTYAQSPVDKRWYSLALQNNTLHYYKIKGGERECMSSDRSGNFTTMNWPNGITFGEVAPWDPVTQRDLIPTLGDSRNWTFTDPQTGTLLKRITLPEDAGYGNPPAASGAAVKFCSENKLTTYDGQAGFFCLFPYGTSGSGALYWFNTSTGESRFQGIADLPGGGSPADAYCSIHVPAGRVVFWDYVKANVIYATGIWDCYGHSFGPKGVLTKVTIHNDGHPVEPGQLWSVSPEVLTDARDHQSLEDLVHHFDPDFNPALFSCGSEYGLTGPYVSLECNAGSQDDPAWLVIYDTSESKVIAAAPSYTNAYDNWARKTGWCGSHGSNAIPTRDHHWIHFSSQQVTTGAVGKFALNLGHDVNATEQEFKVTSAFPGPDPAPGEPYSTKPLLDGSHFLQKSAVSDYFQFLDDTNEIVQVDRKISSGDLIVRRGTLGSSAHAHIGGAQMMAYCPPTYFVWDFFKDPHGRDNTNTYWRLDGLDATLIKGTPHETIWEPYRAGEAWFYRISNMAQPDDGSWFDQIYDASLSPAVPFAGAVHATADGNDFAKHPAWGQTQAPAAEQVWFLDETPYFGASFSHDKNIKVPGTHNLYQYRFAQGHNFDPGIPYFSLQGQVRLKDISGPANCRTDARNPHCLLDGVGGNLRFCVAKNPDECIAGSLGGEVYASLARLDTANGDSCKGNGYRPVTLDDSYDWCVEHVPLYGMGLVQIGMRGGNQIGADNLGRPIYDGRYTRKLVMAGYGPPRKQTGAPQLLGNDGRWAMLGLFFRTPNYNLPRGVADMKYGSLFAVKLPPQPAETKYCSNESSRECTTNLECAASSGETAACAVPDRTNYENIRVPINSAPNGEATQARIKYGYEENGPVSQFYCTQRAETCYSAPLSLNSAHSLRIGIPQRILFYQVEYLDRDTRVVSSGPVTAAAVP